VGAVHRRLPDGSWDGVPPQPYGAGGRRHQLIGPDDGAERYSLRWFEVPLGETTTLERHAHDHGVVLQRGRARVTLGDATHELGPGDVVYVAPGELHSFEAIGSEPLAFICVRSG
jgi:S-methyl-1-thioxylulose 5-phosphate methylthiotransferase